MCCDQDYVCDVCKQYLKLKTKFTEKDWRWTRQRFIIGSSRQRGMQRNSAARCYYTAQLASPSSATPIDHKCLQMCPHAPFRIMRPRLSESSPDSDKCTIISQAGSIMPNTKIENALIRYRTKGLTADHAKQRTIAKRVCD